jgi:hypothetical protein
MDFDEWPGTPSIPFSVFSTEINSPRGQNVTEIAENRPNLLTGCMPSFRTGK